MVYPVLRIPWLEPLMVKYIVLPMGRFQGAHIERHVLDTHHYFSLTLNQTVSLTITLEYTVVWFTAKSWHRPCMSQSVVRQVNSNAHSGQVWRTPRVHPRTLYQL